MTLPSIASLWIGSDLTWLEELCLKSFVDHGHEVVLYCYEPIGNVPDGVTLADASEILPSEGIIRHKRTGSPAYHADLFRLHLMQKTDHIWVDTDAYCHQPFVLPEHGHLHGYTGLRGASLINNGVLRLPRGSATLDAMLAFTADEYPIPPWYAPKNQAVYRELKEGGEGVHVSDHRWGVWGPNALTHFLETTGESRFSMDQDGLYPVPFGEKGKFFRPQRRSHVEAMLSENTLSVHLWGRRFRAVAATYDGIPRDDSWIDTVLKKHAVDPAKTAHILVEAREKRTAERVGMPDFSMLGDDDLVNICLQRSSIVEDSTAINAWIDGDAGPLLDFAAARGMKIAEAAFVELHDQFEAMLPALDENPPDRIADIGAGYGFVDLMLWRRFGCDIVLIDIEESDVRHFHFNEQAAGYANLATARLFLEANGVPPHQITTINPKQEALAQAGEVDVAFSLISCGFHYPAETYDAFYRQNLRPDGTLILDIRTGSRGMRYLKTLGQVDVLNTGQKHAMARVQLSDA